MSLIDVNPGDAKPLEAVPAGEYELSITSAEVVPLKKDPDKRQIALSYKIEGEPLAKSVRDWIGIPHATDDSDIENKKLLKLQAFCDSAQYDYSNGIDTDELPGMVVKAMLTVENDETYGDQNRITRYVTD